MNCIKFWINQTMFVQANKLNPKQAEGRGRGIHPQAGSTLCRAETVSSQKLKLYVLYYILIRFHSECKPVPWDINYCHGNDNVEECLVSLWLNR